MTLKWQSTPMRRNHFDFVADTPRDMRRPGRYRTKKTSGVIQLELLFNGDRIIISSSTNQESIDFLKAEAEKHMERLIGEKHS